MLHLLVATRNAHKTREFVQILGPEFAVSDLTAAAHIPAIAETGQTFEENAILKAIAVSRIVPGLVVADDSGLEVVALGGAPGVYSARYAGEGATNDENVSKLLAELGAIDSRRARFRCALALARGGEMVALVQGEVKGLIAHAPNGEKGFGYDPVFVPAGFEQTFATLGEEMKNKISHRAQAIERLRAYLVASAPTPDLGNAMPRL